MLNIYTFIYQFQVATICTQADVKLLSCTSIEVNRQEAEEQNEHLIGECLLLVVCLSCMFILVFCVNALLCRRLLHIYCVLRVFVISFKM